jgi:tetratricopeptide (TPR) repeat protein
MRKILTYRKQLTVLGGVLAAGMLAGCGNAGEHTADAMQLVQELSYQEALTQFDAASEAGENQRLIARGQGIAYMGMTDYEQAIACFEEALGASDGFVQSVDYDLNFYLAAAYAKNNQYAEAEEVYDAILALRRDEDAYFLRGGVRLELGNFEGAKEDFDQVIAMDSSDYDRLIEIYQALDHYGYQEVGREYLENAMQKAGDKLSSYDSGRMYYYLGEYQEACVVLEKAREENGDAQSSLYLGKAYEATGDYNYAVSVYNAWIAKDTGSAEVYNQLGLCQLAMGNYEQALNAFQTGMQLENNSLMQTMSFNEIVAYEYLEEYQKALVLLENYLKSYPDDEQAQREQQFLSTR